MWRIALLPLLFLSLAYSQEKENPKSQPKPEVAVISADLGECTADLRVTDVKNKPIYNAKLSVEIKYGFLGLHHTTLEVYTNVDGKARFEGLPRKSRGPLAFVAGYEGRKTAVIVEPRDDCHGSFTAILPNEPLPKVDDEDAE